MSVSVLRGGGASRGFDHRSPGLGVRAHLIEQAAGEGGGFALAAFPRADQGGGHAEHAREDGLADPQQPAEFLHVGGFVVAGIGDDPHRAHGELLLKRNACLERRVDVFQVSDDFLCDVSLALRHL